MDRKNSIDFFNKSLKVIPGGVNSGAQAFLELGITPLVVESGKGARIRDIDGNEYIDFCNSWGALILGHAPERVVEATKKRVEMGSTFGIHNCEEQPLAKMLVDLLPGVEKVRFFCSGTEATMTAARMARGYTGRDTIVKFTGCYHGHYDGFLVKAGSGVVQLNDEASSKGVPKDFVKHTVCLTYNDIEEARNFLRTHDVAGVIIEPIAGNMGVVPADPAFLQMLREETEKQGALLILDEVISGFRVGLQGAAGLYGIDADMITYGKVLGGGFPMAAIGGKAKYLDQLPPLGEVYQAGTLAGNPVAMVAGRATLEEISRPEFYAELQEKADYLLEPLEREFQNLPIQITRRGSMFTIFWGHKNVDKLTDLNWEYFRKYFKFLLDKGIYMSPSPYETCFISSAHTKKDLDYVRDVIKEFAALLFSSNYAKIEGCY